MVIDIVLGMGGECFNCANAVEDRYTLVLNSGEVFKDKLLCEPCDSAFRGLDWIEVHEGPVLMRGGDDDQEKDASK